MGFLAALPLIGKFFETAERLVDNVSTTDEERLSAKLAMDKVRTPLFLAIITAQAQMEKYKIDLFQAEMKSEHFLVWARRPIIALVSFATFMGVLYANVAGYPQATWDLVKFTGIIAGAINGFDITTRGIEKTVKVMKSKEII